LPLAVVALDASNSVGPPRRNRVECGALVCRLGSQTRAACLISSAFAASTILNDA